MKNVIIMICGVLGAAVGTYLTIIDNPNSFLWIGFGLALGIYGYLKHEFSNEEIEKNT